MRKTMKVILLTLAFYCLSVTAFSQSITLNLSDITVKEAIQTLKEKTGYSFVYEVNDIDTQRKISVKTTNKTIDEVVKQILIGQNVSSAIQGKSIVITKIQKSTLESNQINETKEVKIINGLVTDEKGEPIIGANIMIEGTKTGTISDSKGGFELEIREKSTIAVTYIGYVAKRNVSVEGKSNIRITLIEDTKFLSEVVVVGFGSQKKENLTGAVSTVSPEMLKDRPVQNIAQALQGVSPGLNINQDQGRLDMQPSLNIRGLETIGDGSSGGPLVLIDGMEGNMNILNPQDVESISVLKDAAASSIYGARAPFGVILITTKSGKADKITMNYNNSFRWNTPINTPKMADSYSWALFMNDADLWGDQFNPEWLKRIKDYQDGTLKNPLYVDPTTRDYANPYWGGANGNVDWYKALYRENGSSDEHTASVSGGTERLKVYASANYLKMNGLLRYNEDNFQRLATNIKVDAKVWDNVDLTYNTKFNRTDFGRPSNFTDGIYQDIARQGWPMFPINDNNGHLYYDGGKAALIRDGGRDKTISQTQSQQFKVRIEPLKGWQIIGEVNYRGENNTHHWDTQKIFAYTASNQVRESATKESSVHEDAMFSTFMNYNLYSDYVKTFESGHFFKILAGFQAEDYDNNIFGVTRNGIIVQGINVIDKTTGLDSSGKEVQPTVNGSLGKWTTAGFFGRLNYSYKDKYLFEANVRYDGTSRFRVDSRWVTSPSFSVGWNLAKENFWEPLLNTISTFKFRGSYGQLANQNTSSWYPTYVTMPLGVNSGNWLIDGKKPNTADAPGLVSSDLTWETVRSMNIGLDAAMFRNRLNINFDYYKRDTKNMIGPPPVLPVTLGTNSPKMNNTSLSTKGWELSVNWQDRFRGGLGYKLGLSVSDDNTLITDYPSTNTALNAFYKGKIMGEIWGYETVGIAKTNEEMTQHLASLPNGGQDALGSNWAAGDIMYKDLNGDGKISLGDYTKDNPGDLKVIGNSNAHYRFGVNLSADYKGFDFSVFLQGVMKRDFAPNGYTPTFFGAHPWGIWWSQALVQHLDYFRNDPNHPLGLNLDSYYPRPSFSSQNYETQTRYLQDASYIRLKNIQLGYTIPNQWIKKVHISNLRLYVSGENLLTFTKLAKMYDPETVYGGWAGTVYPLSSTYSCGLSVNF